MTSPSSFLSGSFKGKPTLTFPYSLLAILGMGDCNVEGKSLTDTKTASEAEAAATAGALFTEERLCWMNHIFAPVQRQASLIFS